MIESATSRGGRTYTLLVDELLARLPNEDRDALLGALHDRSWSDRALAEVVTRGGYRLSTGAIQKWRVRNGVRGND